MFRHSRVERFGYDPFGRRLWKETGGTRTYFCYSAEGLIGEYDIDGLEIRSYGYGPDSIQTTDPLYLKENGVYYWYQNDANGTPQKLIRTDGSVAWAATYDSFGNVQIQVEEVVNNLRFAGQYFDAETGLYYNWHRYYDPALGRYLQADPLGEIGLNLYEYCFNNPNGWIDPSGLCATQNVLNGNNLLNALDKFSDNYKKSFDTTNKVFFHGLFNDFFNAKTLLGFFTAGFVANKTGTLTWLEALEYVIYEGGIANLGIVGTIGSAVANSVINTTVCFVGLEAGISVGSLVNALPVYESDKSVGDWWVDTAFDYFNK